jgi:hypothetical protein
MAQGTKAIASKSVQGKITQLLLHNNQWNNVSAPGYQLVFIQMAELPQVPGGFARVAVKDDYPGFDRILNMATAALAANRTVTLTYLESSITRQNSWDFGQLTLHS